MTDFVLTHGTTQGLEAGNASPAVSTLSVTAAPRSTSPVATSDRRPITPEQSPSSLRPR